MTTLLEKIDNDTFNRGRQIYDRIDTWGNGAIIVQPRTINTYRAKNGVQKIDRRIDQPVYLISGDDLLVNGKTCYVGSDRAYNAEYGRTSRTDSVWINRAATMICAGQHPDHDTLKIALEIGQLVMVDGGYYRIQPTWNDNFVLDPVDLCDTCGDPIPENYGADGVCGDCHDAAAAETA